MKKLLWLCTALIVCFWTVIAAWYTDDWEYVQSVQWMYDQWMTKYSGANQFNPWASVTREQAAKFFYVYSQTLWKETADLSESVPRCEFSDALVMDKTLKEYVISSCHVSIMNGSQWKFMPTNYLTKAEALTVLLRISHWWALVEDVNPRWRNYYEEAYNTWLTKETDVWNLDKPLTRYEIALLISRAAWNKFEWSETDQDIKLIEDILWEVFGLQTQ